MRDQLKSSECSRYLKAIADPDRLKLIQCLGVGPRHVGDLTRELHKPIANVSHHLGLLKNAGIVNATKKGRFVLYTLAPRFLRQASQSPLNVLDFGCCRLELGAKDKAP
ncbi:MAG TPA: metalloregulator ArsR/SmtB family transcription factor [Humisphaera sp.]|nr:metalloregulator ArsR/SmtB family transcription factor [Humisphaera sp.]